MSPTSCQTAPPRARVDANKLSERREGELSHFAARTSTTTDAENSGWPTGPLRISRLEATSGRAPLQDRLREGAAVHVLQLAPHGQPPGDPGDLQALPGKKLADVVRGG